MNYRALQLACYCGDVPDRIMEIGVTSDRNLVLFVSRSLEECGEMCPEPEASTVDNTAADARFLQSIGIATDTQP
jgi:hypothetical protein